MATDVLNPTMNRTYFVTTKGPLLLQFITDRKVVGRGFKMSINLECLPEIQPVPVTSLLCGNMSSSIQSIDCTRKKYIISTNHPYSSNDMCRFSFQPVKGTSPVS